MCGILGAVGCAPERSAFEAALGLIEHRGPDSDGVTELRPGTLLGFRRLSIIDLSAAADQPMTKHGLSITFNGEIYNYRDLRRELESSGATFRTTSDTEVLLEAWHRWGPACLDRLRGMFAFAIGDSRTGQVDIVRDHFGIKPLYYAKTAGGTVYGSELKAILPLLDRRPSISSRGLAGALMYYWVPEPDTMYEGIRKLPAGCRATLSPDGEVTVHRWWDPKTLLEPGPEVDADGLRQVMEESIRAHLVADVPVGVFLSGGLDSSFVTAVAATGVDNLQAFTIGFRDVDQRFENMPDDLRYARRFARQLGIGLEEIIIEPELSERLPEMVGMLDEPIGDAAALNTFLICDMARSRGMKVLLSGMGADEFFGGYRKHQAGLLAARYRSILPGMVRRGAVEPLVRRLPVAGSDRGYRYARWANRFVDFASLDEEPSYQRSYAMHGIEALRGLADPALHSAFEDVLDAHAAIYAEAESADHVNRMCYTDLRLFLPSLNLAYTDRASMAASVEVRVPFVDVEVARAAFQIPGSKKISGRRRKAILGDAARGWVPDEIVDRPKGLFSAPLRSWIKGDLAHLVDDALLRGELISDGILQGPAVDALVEADRAGAEDNSKEIWQLLTLELWYRRSSRTLQVAS